MVLLPLSLTSFPYFYVLVKHPTSIITWERKSVLAARTEESKGRTQKERKGKGKLHIFGDVLLCITEVHGVFFPQSLDTKESRTEAQSF